MRFFIFATIFLLVFLIIIIYISRRFVKKVHFKQRYKNYFNIFLWLNFVGIVGYMIFRYYPVVPNSIYFMFSIPIGIIFLLFTTTVIYDIFLFAINRTQKDEKRREFLKKSLDIGSVALATGINAKALYNARHTLLENVTVKVKNLQKNYSLVQISDVHIGGLIDQAFIASLVKRINALKPDVIVITGDLVDTDIKYAQKAMDELQYLKSTYGTYFVTGNHEFFHNVEVLMKHLRSIGITVLENESVYIGDETQGFNLAGVHDVFGYRVNKLQPDITKALSNIQKEGPTILLAHQPRFLEEVPQSVDLVLSGHTHGGQLVPFNYLVRLVQPYVKGLHQHNENTQIYVNKGTGFWGPPMRLGASSEITHIQLTKA